MYAQAYKALNAMQQRLAEDAFAFASRPWPWDAVVMQEMTREEFERQYPSPVPDPFTREGERSIQELLDELGATAAMIEKVSS
jgi:hypothetical protein